MDNILIRNFKRIPYFFEPKLTYHAHQHNYALIGKLSTSLLHDILTPLCSLSLTTDIDNSNTIQELKPVIKSSALQIQEYVQIMKDFMVDIQIDSLIHINKEISKCLVLLRHRTIVKNIQIQFIEFDQIHTHVHPLHVYQIIINLVSNAIDACDETDNKKIILILKKDAGYFYIECKDFGSGMSPQIIEQLGTCNFSTKSNLRGFGLYSVKHIVTNILNGELDIKSEPDNGSLFSCRLPILK